MKQKYEIIQFVENITNVWPAMPKPATYAHYGKEKFS